MLCLHRSSSLASWRLSEEVQSIQCSMTGRPEIVVQRVQRELQVAGGNPVKWGAEIDFSYKPRGYLLPILGFILQRKMGFGGLVLKDISSHSLHHVSHSLFFVGSMKPIFHHHHAFIERIDYSSDPIPAPLELQAIWVRPERIGCKCLLTHPVKIHTVHLHWYCNSVNKLVIWIYGAILYTVVAFCCKETFSMIRHDSARPKNWRYREQTRHFRCIRGWYPQLRRFFLLVWGRVPTPRWLCFTYISPLRFFHL